MSSATDELLDLHDWLRTGEARRIRERARLSAAALARDIDVTPGAVNKWELGLRLPQGANALRYARLLRRLAARESGS